MRIILIFFSFLVFGCVSKISKKEHSLYWHSQSAEYKALCIQAYNIARAKLDKELLKDHNKPIAIVADLDETVLNNTPFNEMLLDEDLTYNQDLWSKWVNKKIGNVKPEIIASFHPAFLMRQPDQKKYAWEDLKMIRKKMSELKIKLND